jgi:hypothetical protein
LLPLTEIAPQCVIPGCGRAAQLLESCRDQRLSKLDPGPASQPPSNADSPGGCSCK